jgi:RNA polymerase sigma-70 factor, ECF subfamily
MGSSERNRVRDSPVPGRLGLRQLDEWCRSYRDRLRLAVAMRLDRRVAARVDASDIIQEAFVEAAERFGQYEQDREDPAKAGLTPYLWLRFIALQRLLIVHRRHLKAQNRAAGREVALAGPGTSVTAAGLAELMVGTLTSPSRSAAKAESLDRLHAALQQLEEADREVLALRHFEHLSNEEAAGVLGIQPPAASQRYYRALKRLKERVLPLLDEVTGP